MTPARRRALWRQVGERIATRRDDCLCDAINHVTDHDGDVEWCELITAAEVTFHLPERECDEGPFFWWRRSAKGRAARLIACAWMIATAGEEW